MAQSSNTQPDLPQTASAKVEAALPDQPEGAAAAESAVSTTTLPPAEPTAPTATASQAPVVEAPSPPKDLEGKVIARLTVPEKEPEAKPAPASIPAASIATPAVPTAVVPPTSSTPKKAEPSFLYVEDDPFSREVLTRIIKQNMGFANLTVFEDSSDFMHRVKNLPAIPDVILLDIQISPLNGHQMLKLLRDDKMFEQTKIIALTASVMASEVKQLQDAGFDGLIGKPVMKRVFPELLHRILEGEPVWYVS